MTPETFLVAIPGAETGWMQIWLDSGRNSQGTSATDGPACHIDLSPANAYCALSRLLPVAEFASGLMGHAPLRRFLSKHLPGMAKQLRYSGDGLAGGAMSSAMDFRVRLQGLSVLVPCGHSWHSSGHRREAAGSLAISFTDVTLARMDPTVDCRSVGGRSGLSGAAANGVAEEDEGEEASPSPTAPGIGLWMRKMCGARSFKRLTAESTVESWLTCGAPSESIPVLEPLHVRLELQTATAAGNPISSASKQPGYLPLRQRLVHASASTGDIKVYISPFLAYSLVSISKETSDLVRGLQHLGAASPSSQGAQAMPRMPAQLSIQASVPRLIASVIRKEKSSAAEGLEKEGLFCIALTNSSVSLASDSLGSELRFSVEQTSVVMAGASKLGKGTTTSLLTPIPPMVLALFASKRWRLKRSFFAWRSASSHDKPIGSQVGIVRRLVQHRLVSCHNGQVSGSLSLDWAARHVQVVADTSPLITNLDTKMVTHMESFAAALCQLIEQEAAASANHVAGREEAASGSTVNQMPKALPPGGGLSLSLMVRLASVHSVAQSSGIRIFSASVEDPLLTVVAAPNPVGQPGEGQRDVTARLTAHSLCVRDLLCPNPWFSKVISDNSENTESTSPGRPGAQVSIWLETTWARPAVTLRQTPLEQGCSVPSSRRTSAENLSSSSRQHPPGSSPPVCRWVVRINLEHARLVALSRFAADTGYFLHSFVEALRRLQAAAASVSTVHSPSGSDPGSRDSWGSEAPPPAARPSSVSFQLTVLGLTVDLPRNSLAHEYYTVAVGSAEVMLPVSSSSMSNYRQSQLNAAPENGGEATGRCGQTAPGRRADRGRPFDLSTDKLPSTRSNPPGGRNGPHAKDRIKGQYKASSAPSSPANIGRCSSQGRRISRLVASAGNSSSMEGKPFEEVLEYKVSSCCAGGYGDPLLGTSASVSEVLPKLRSLAP